MNLLVTLAAVLIAVLICLFIVDKTFSGNNNNTIKLVIGVIALIYIALVFFGGAPMIVVVR